MKQQTLRWYLYEVKFVDNKKQINDTFIGFKFPQWPKCSSNVLSHPEDVHDNTEHFGSVIKEEQKSGNSLGYPFGIKKEEEKLSHRLILLIYLDQLRSVHIEVIESNGISIQNREPYVRRLLTYKIFFGISIFVPNKKAEICECFQLHSR